MVVSCCPLVQAALHSETETSGGAWRLNSLRGSSLTSTATLQLPSEYPFKPPEIYMTTPSGRFEVRPTPTTLLAASAKLTLHPPLRTPRPTRRSASPSHPSIPRHGSPVGASARLCWRSWPSSRPRCARPLDSGWWLVRASCEANSGAVGLTGGRSGRLDGRERRGEEEVGKGVSCEWFGARALGERLTPPLVPADEQIQHLPVRNLRVRRAHLSASRGCPSRGVRSGHQRRRSGGGGGGGHHRRLPLPIALALSRTSTSTACRPSLPLSRPSSPPRSSTAYFPPDPFPLEHHRRRRSTSRLCPTPPPTPPCACDSRCTSHDGRNGSSTCRARRVAPRRAARGGGVGPTVGVGPGWAA